MILIFLYIYICIQYVECTYSAVVPEMNSEDLKRLSHPQEYGRADMYYGTILSRELDPFLNALSLKNVSKLHITIEPVHMGTLNITQIYKLQNLAELWIVKSKRNMKMTFIGNINTWKLVNLRKLHLKFVYGLSKNLALFLRSISNLEVLEMSGLRYTGSLYGIMESLKNKPLSVLKLNQFESMDAKTAHDTFHLSPRSLFEPLINASLLYLEMCDNLILSFEPGLYDVFPVLRIFNLSRNLLLGSSEQNTMFADVILNPVLEVINLSDQFANVPLNIQKRSLYNRKNQSPDWNDRQKKRCEHSVNFSDNNYMCKLIRCFIQGNISCSVIPQDMTLGSLTDFNCEMNMRLPIGKRLKELIIDNASTYAKQIHGVLDHTATACLGPNNLQKLSIARNKAFMNYRRISESLPWLRLKGFESVSELDIGFNDLNISLPLFLELKNLTHLNLQGNTIILKETTDICLCSLFAKLKRLDISRSVISDIPHGFFKDCQKSLLTLNLQYNNIDENAIGNDLTNILKLRDIDMSFNKIHYFTAETRKILQDKKFGLTHIDFTGNPFTCDCSYDSIETIKILKGEFEHLTFVQRKIYQCHHSDNMTGYQFVQQINIDEYIRQCHTSNTPAILISVTVISSAAALCCAVILAWRYRFHLVTKYYRVKRNNRICMFQRHADYKYDAFVAYCSEDRYWVHDVLMQILENKYDFKLCIHYRDFMLGENIDDEIVRNMSWSRAHIVILSDNSVKKMWPNFELERAYTEAINEGKDLIVIKFGTINTEDVPGLVTQILDSRVYLQWPDRSKYVPKLRQELFWAKLASRLYGEKYPCYLKDVCCCCRRAIRGVNINEVIDDSTQLVTDEYC